MENFYKFNISFDKKNKTFKWLATDSEELYDKNFAKRKTRKKLQEFGWTKDSITYIFNSEGYRSPEFEKNGIVCFGCSHTRGTGVKYEQTWPYLLGKSLNLPICNFGTSGSSSDTAFRLANYWIDALQPKYVFCLRPERSRREYVHIDDQIFIEHMGPWTSDSKFNLLTHDYADLTHDQKNMIGIEYICNKNKAKYYNIGQTEVKASGFNVQYLHQHGGHARDLCHLGPSFLVRVHDLFLEKMG